MSSEKLNSKVNGYTEQEAIKLIEFIENGKKEGKTLSSLFLEYGELNGRAKGSVRNYYYQFLKSVEIDERVKNIMSNKNLTANKIVSFTDEEINKMLEEILLEKSKGVSIRKAIQNVADGDDKKILRYQNKFRNINKNSPELIEKVIEKLGLNIKIDRNKKDNGLESRLQKEIDNLYERLASSIRAENENLRKTIEELREENERLRESDEILRGRIKLTNKNNIC